MDSRRLGCALEWDLRYALELEDVTLGLVCPTGWQRRPRRADPDPRPGHI